MNFKIIDLASLMSTGQQMAKSRLEWMGLLGVGKSMASAKASGVLLKLRTSYTQEIMSFKQPHDHHDTQRFAELGCQRIGHTLDCIA